MRTLPVLATLVTIAAFASPASQGSSQTSRGGSQRSPIVSATQAPVGAETLAVQWLSVAVPDRGVMLAAVARPSGAGPFPAVLVLHGTHGFARQSVHWAQELARGGFLAVAACWFSGGGGPTLHEVAPIPCPDIPPLGAGDYPEGQQYVDALVQATRALPDARPERLALAGHSRGGGATLQYLLANGQAQAAILHSSGYALRPETRAAEFNVPILIMHGTADSSATGGSANTEVGRARAFETALRRNQKPVEASYYEEGGHGTFFTKSTQRDDELKTMIAFLRRHLGR